VIVAALGAPQDPQLDRLLGADGARQLREELAARARRWAAAAAPGRAFEATTLAAALEDLAVGCDVVVGVTHDARPYLIAVPDIDSELVDLVEGSFGGGVLAAFAERGLSLGMVRHERRLASAADARALAIDPLAPPDLAALVRGRLSGLPDR